MNKDLTLMTDLYQLTMMQGYFKSNLHTKKAVFDMFYRKNPSKNGYAICCGLEQVIDYIKNISFNDDNINYLKSLNIFDDKFLNFLRGFKFSGDIYAIPEGTVVFPNEPLVRVSSTVIEAQFIETAILNIINHQSLIATKASRIAWATKGDGLLEFGLRRAQSPDAAIYGSRASVIGGCDATSNVLAGKMFDIPVAGTHAHSWIMSFDSELAAFRTYANIYKHNCTLLVDTFDTLESGVPNAITVFSELRKAGKLPKTYGIRLDSGDLSYLSTKARDMLDKSKFYDAKITASSDLDEYIISSLKQQDTKIDNWGVGTKLITSSDQPAFGGVYKLCAIEDDNGVLTPKIKLSENTDKITTPDIKKVVRIYDSSTKKIKADLICLDNEMIDIKKDLTIFHPINTWKKMTLKANTFTVRELLEPVFVKGECVYKKISVLDIKKYCDSEKNTLWDEHKRLINPHILPVDLSLNLYNLKKDMINSLSQNNISN